MTDKPFPYRAVIFDLDGLLLDTESVALTTGVATFAALGHPVPEHVLHRLVGVEAEAGFRQICQWLGKELDFQTTNGALVAAFREGLSDGIPLKPGAVQILDALDRIGLPRAVATNSQIESAHWKIDRTPLKGRFDAIIGADMAPAPKPAPGVYLEAAKALGIAPEFCLAFEDSDLGVRAAKAAGMTVIQIPDVLASAEHAADREFTSMAEAMAHLGL